MRAYITLFVVALVILPAFVSANYDEYEVWEALKYDREGNFQERLTLPYEIGYPETLRLAAVPGGGALLGFERVVYKLRDDMGLVWDPYLSPFFIVNDILAADDGGCVVAGYDEGFEVLWVDADGETIASDTRNGGTGWDEDIAYALTYDGQGRTIVTGTLLNQGNTTLDVLTVCYATPGTEAWAVEYDHGSNVGDGGYALVVDGDDNVIVGGYTLPSGNRDMLVLKYDADGALQWNASHDCPAGENDTVRFVAADSAGNVYAAGECGLPGSRRLLALVKYDADGVFQWEKKFDDFDGAFYNAVGLAVIDDDLIVIAGNVLADKVSYMAVFACDAAGDEVWRFFNAGNSDFSEEVRPMAVDDAGNIYVHSHNEQNYVTCKLDRDGNLLWQHVLDANVDLGMYDFCEVDSSSLTLDADDGLFVAGALLCYGYYSDDDTWIDDDDNDDDNDDNDTDDDDDAADDDDDDNDDDDNDDGCGCAVSERNPAAPLAAVMLLIGLALMVLGKRR